MTVGIAIDFILVGLILLTVLYVIYKLNIYISKLEDRLKKQIELTENLKQSLKEIIADGFLLDDGRLKKMHIQTERNVIFNGVKVSEETVEY